MVAPLAALLALSSPAAAQVGSPYCFGTACPCGNDDPAAGCGNDGFDGDPATGATLAHLAGGTGVVLDDLVLGVEGLAPGQSGGVFMGGATALAPFGDGFQCVVGGGLGIHRFPPRTVDGQGRFEETGLAERSRTFADTGRILPGATWYFQSWYRDPAGPCGTGLNLSNALPVTFTIEAPIEVELTGRPLAAYPFFEFRHTFNAGSPVKGTVDAEHFPWLTGQLADVYVVEERGASEWAQNPALVDVRGAPLPVNFPGIDVYGNVFSADAGVLPAPIGAELGIGYDLVLDFDQDGQLSAGDLIDGRGDEAGFSVVRDVVAPGPYQVIEVTYSGGSFLGQNLYYPSSIADLGELPLVVVSHGNGHNLSWYDHIGYHLASYGYVVMSHQNNTVPGVAAASLTTITNTDYILGNLATIAGGELDGHVDTDTIVWIGHSRGGEGVVRAYDRVLEGVTVPSNFTADDIKLISSIAPTNFLGPASSDPHDVPLQLWVGAADADVHGGPSQGIANSYPLHERAEGPRYSVTLHGAGHGVFHDGGGSWVAAGPCQIGRTKTHKLMKGYLLPLMRWVLDGKDHARDFLWRDWDTLRPIGAPADLDCIVVKYEYNDGPGTGLMLDDFQTSPAMNISSSGTAVTYDVAELHEGEFDDISSGLTWTAGDPMNGMTRAVYNADDSAGVVFQWETPSFYQVEIPSGERDLRDDGFLSFRACQMSRHPLTVASLDALDFDVVLVDALGSESRIAISATSEIFGDPYQRAGEGSGVGWSNELETTRMRLADFVAGDASLDLARVKAIRFEFGGPGRSAAGRIGLDEIQITKD